MADCALRGRLSGLAACACARRASRVRAALDSSSFFLYPNVDAEIADTATFFGGRNEHDWDRLLACTETRRFRPGEIVLRAGEADRALYLLADGGLELLAHGAAAVPIEAPATFGEGAFLDGRPRTSSLRALTHGELERLSWEAFEALSARDPQLGRDILVDVGRVLAARLRAGGGTFLG
jgi:CRP/FNR family cyclic AMP-dependent transcriptional regulator